MTNNNYSELVEVIRAALEEHSIVGIRGLTGANAQKKYRKNQTMKKSFDTWDERECSYSSSAPTLSGTSAFLLDSYWDDEQIIEAIENAKGEVYSDKGKTCLIYGDYYEMGDDQGEVVISTGMGRGHNGAKFLRYI